MGGRKIHQNCTHIQFDKETTEQINWKMEQGVFLVYQSRKKYALAPVKIQK